MFFYNNYGKGKKNSNDSQVIAMLKKYNSGLTINTSTPQWHTTDPESSPPKGSMEIWLAIKPEVNNLANTCSVINSFLKQQKQQKVFVQLFAGSNQSTLNERWDYLYWEPLNVIRTPRHISDLRGTECRIHMSRKNYPSLLIKLVQALLDKKVEIDYITPLQKNCNPQSLTLPNGQQVFVYLNANSSPSISLGHQTIQLNKNGLAAQLAKIKYLSEHKELVFQSLVSAIPKLKEACYYGNHNLLSEQLRKLQKVLLSIGELYEKIRGLENACKQLHAQIQILSQQIEEQELKLQAELQKKLPKDATAKDVIYGRANFKAGKQLNQMQEQLKQKEEEKAKLEKMLKDNRDKLSNKEVCYKKLFNIIEERYPQTVQDSTISVENSEEKSVTDLLIHLCPPLKPHQVKLALSACSTLLDQYSKREQTIINQYQEKKVTKIIQTTLKDLGQDTIQSLAQHHPAAMQLFCYKLQRFADEQDALQEQQKTFIQYLIQSFPKITTDSQQSWFRSGEDNHFLKEAYSFLQQSLLEKLENLLRKDFSADYPDDKTFAQAFMTILTTWKNTKLTNQHCPGNIYEDHSFESILETWDNSTQQKTSNSISNLWGLWSNKEKPVTLGEWVKDLEEVLNASLGKNNPTLQKNPAV